MYRPKITSEISDFIKVNLHSSNRELQFMILDEFGLDISHVAIGKHKHKLGKKNIVGTFLEFPIQEYVKRDNSRLHVKYRVFLQLLDQLARNCGISQAKRQEILDITTFFYQQALDS